VEVAQEMLELLRRRVELDVLLEVAAGRERLAVAGDHDNLDCRLAFKFRQSCKQFLHGAPVERVQPQRRHQPVTLDFDAAVFPHALPLLSLAG